MKLLKVLTTKHKRKIMIDGILWANRCYRAGWLTRQSAISHVKSCWYIVSTWA